MMATSDSISAAYLSGLERHGTGYTDDAGNIYVSLPERLPYQEDDDAFMHICKGGERVFDLAIAYFKDVYPNPVDIWQVIAQYQEDPIIDASVPLTAGDIIMIPPVSYVEMVAYGDPLTDLPRI